jgi:hypothetical protein
MGRRISRDAIALGYLVEVVDEVVRRTTSGSATRHDYAVARAALQFLLAVARRVENHLADELSERQVTGINHLRHTCARYEAMLWQPTPIFLRS